MCIRIKADESNRSTLRGYYPVTRTISRQIIDTEPQALV